MIKITKNWHNLLTSEFEKDYFKELQKFLQAEYSSRTIYPKIDNIFNALNFCKYDNIKVVIIGQDPYHQPNQALGFALQFKTA